MLIKTIYIMCLKNTCWSSDICAPSTDLVEFSDEEGYGRYLDLHDCYLKYINLKGAEVTILLKSVSFMLHLNIIFLTAIRILSLQKLEYISYLSSFDQLFDIPKDRKNAEYKK